jgi:hypothetical protein
MRAIRPRRRDVVKNGIAAAAAPAMAAAAVGTNVPGVVFQVIFAEEISDAADWNMTGWRAA